MVDQIELSSIHRDRSGRSRSPSLQSGSSSGLSTPNSDGLRIGTIAAAPPAYSARDEGRPMPSDLRRAYDARVNAAASTLPPAPARPDLVSFPREGTGARKGLLPTNIVGASGSHTEDPEAQSTPNRWTGTVLPPLSTTTASTTPATLSLGQQVQPSTQSKRKSRCQGICAYTYCIGAFLLLSTLFVVMVFGILYDTGSKPVRHLLNTWFEHDSPEPAQETGL